MIWKKASTFFPLFSFSFSFLFRVGWRRGAPTCQGALQLVDRVHEDAKLLPAHLSLGLDAACLLLERGQAGVQRAHVRLDGRPGRVLLDDLGQIVVLLLVSPRLARLRQVTLARLNLCDSLCNLQVFKKY